MHLFRIAESTELSRKQVASVFDALADQIKSAVGKKGPGVFAVPGLMKIIVVQKPATKAKTATGKRWKFSWMASGSPTSAWMCRLVAAWRWRPGTALRR